MAETSELKQLWFTILTALSQRIPRSDFITWFKNTAILSQEATMMIIGTPTVFNRDMLVKNFEQPLLETVQTILPEIQTLSFVVEGFLHDKDERVINLLQIAPDPKKKNPPQEITLIEGITSKVLNSKYNLENFVVGPDNQLAHAACMAVARKPGEAYNPLFVYGGVGLGKTHLLQGTGNEILKRYPKKIVVYATSEKFTNEVIEAIRNRKGDKLREKYRQVDVLIIDDIQFLANKEQTQIEFFHTFNTLHEAHKQIIISSDRPPKELDSLEPRLRSRFEWGMMADVGFPDFETRVAILQMKAQEKGVFISNDVMAFIASNVTESVRELEGVLHQAIALYELRNITPTVKSIAPMLKKLHSADKLVGLPDSGSVDGVRTIEDIVRVIADYYKLRPEDLIGDNRRADIVLARQIAMYIAKKYFKMTFQYIGTHFHDRIHTTVMHACDKIIKEMEEDKQLKRDINALLHDMGVL
jgi:chromosomal replication initiator protein